MSWANLNNVQYLYRTDPAITSFIDFLVEYTFDNLQADVTMSCNKDLICRIIYQFWVVGFVVYDSNVIYNPSKCVFSYTGMKLTNIHCGDEDISNKAIFLARKSSDGNFLGSVINDNRTINSFDPYAFNRAYARRQTVK